MRLTTKGRYAVTALLDLVLHQQEESVKLGDIARRQGISLCYLEQLFARLRKQGLVESARGPGGGYHLGRAASAISVADVISAVDEKVDATRCGGKLNCQADERCLTHDLWSELNNQIRDFLNGIKLADLVEKSGVKEVAARQEYIQLYGMDGKNVENINNINSL